MAKVIQAECVNNKVTVEGVEIEGAQILTQGKAQSTGILIVDDDRIYYVSTNTTDLKTTLEKLASAMTKVTETLTAIGTGMTGPTTAPPGVLPTNVANINATVGELTTLKDNLK